MQDDKQWAQWSQQWQKQEVGTAVDIEAIKKRVNKHRLQKLSYILLDIILLIVVVYLWFSEFRYGLSWSAQQWLFFGMLFGIVVTVIGTYIRLKDWQDKAITTRDWIDYEIRRANNRLTLTKLSYWSISTFALFFHIWLLVGHFYDPHFVLEWNVRIVTIYTFAIVWMGLFWWITSRIKKSAKRSKQHFEQEKQWLIASEQP